MYYKTPQKWGLYITPWTKQTTFIFGFKKNNELLRPEERSFSYFDKSSSWLVDFSFFDNVSLRSLLPSKWPLILYSGGYFFICHILRSKIITLNLNILKLYIRMYVIQGKTSFDNLFMILELFIWNTRSQVVRLVWHEIYQTVFYWNLLYLLKF